MSNFREIEGLVLSLAVDASQFWDKGNKAAGTRLRKGMQELKRLAQAERDAVLARKETNKRIL